MIYTGSTAASLGWLISLLDATVIDYGGPWSVFDASAGTNAKVYRCYDADENIDFYVHVDDNLNTAYTGVRICEGWDAGTHAVIGNSTSWTYWQKTASRLYDVIVHDDYFIYMFQNPSVLNSGRGFYVGMPTRLDPTLQMAMVCGGMSTTYHDYNSLGTGFYSGTTDAVHWRLLYGVDGTPNNRVASWGCQDLNQGAYFKDYSGVWHFCPTILTTLNSAVGWVHGSVDAFFSPDRMDAQNAYYALAGGQLININGVLWKVIDGDSLCGCAFVRYE